MATARQNTDWDGTWSKSWVCDTTAERMTLLAIAPSLGGPRRGDTILDNEVGQTFYVLGGGTSVRFTGNAPSPVDLNADVTGILPIANGGTGVNDFIEEGAWTPVLSFGGASVGITYTIQEGKFIRNGNFIFVTGAIVLSNKGVSVGNAIISGLSYAFGGANANYSTAVVDYGTFNAPLISPYIVALIGTQTMAIKYGTVAAPTVVTDVHFTNGSALLLGGLGYFRT